MDGDSSAKFIGSLTKFLQSLCNGYVEFQRGVELVGHIYLSIDTGEKVDYILHEKVSKNDENSVTFVSNSFHAQPQDKDKAKEPLATGNAKASKSENLQDDDDDDDIMIVDQSSQGVIGSTNSGSISSRGVKRMSSPGSDLRHGQRVRISLGSSSAHNMSGHSYGSGNRQHSGRPSATVTSQGGSQNENLNISEVKLEQISKDELLSLASQVGDGTSGPSQTSSAASHSQSQLSGSSRGDAAMWVKQEVPDDDGGTDAGWPQERDDSNSNSGSNLYPVMLHPNPSAFPPSSIPGYSGPGGSGNQSAFPMPGSSQDMSGLDPAVSALGALYRDTFVARSVGQCHPAPRLNSAESNDGSHRSLQQWGYSSFAGMDSNKASSYQPADLNSLSPRKRKVVVTQMWREKLKQNPEAYRQYRLKQQQYVRKYRAKKRLLKYYSENKPHLS